MKKDVLRVFVICGLVGFGNAAMAGAKECEAFGFKLGVPLADYAAYCKPSDDSSLFFPCKKAPKPDARFTDFDLRASDRYAPVTVLIHGSGSEAKGTDVDLRKTLPPRAKQILAELVAKYGLKYTTQTQENGVMLFSWELGDELKDDVLDHVRLTVYPKFDYEGSEFRFSIDCIRETNWSR
jgi:hypothetical protein